MAFDPRAYEQDLQEYRPHGVLLWGAVLALLAMVGIGVAMLAGWLQ